MEFLTKYLSRKFFAAIPYPSTVAIAFHLLGISETTTLAVLGLAGVYLGANVMSKKKVES